MSFPRQPIIFSVKLHTGKTEIRYCSPLHLTFMVHWPKKTNLILLLKYLNPQMYITTFIREFVQKYTALWIPCLLRYVILQAKKECPVFIYSQGQARRSFKYLRSGMHLFIQRNTVAEPLWDGWMSFLLSASCVVNHSSFIAVLTSAYCLYIAQLFLAVAEVICKVFICVFTQIMLTKSLTVPQRLE